VRVLYITAEVPYPLTSGYLRHFHFLRGLAAEHEITHLSLTRRGQVPSEARAALAPFVVRLDVFGDRGPARGGRAGRAVRLRGAARDLRAAVAERLAAGATDVVLLSGKDTFAALDAVERVPLVIDVCDAASLRLGGELAVAPWRQRPLLAARQAEIARVERRLVARTPHLMFASARDRTALAAPHGVVVPNGIDARYWTRRAAPGDGAIVVFSGVMAYRPNHDAAVRLVRGVMPRLRARVPGARLVVAGRDPLPALRAAAARTGEVELTGACPDLRPHLEAAAVYCAPLRFASGIQNKLLEALAMELPVVTTSVAAAGLRVAGEDPPLLVADDDDGLAAALALLLADPAQRARLAAAGRRYVERHFCWSRSIARVDEVLRRAVGASAPGRAPVVASGARS
jgi:glycosyltransferase involved in cell wall biosynthesis